MRDESKAVINKPVAEDGGDRIEVTGESKTVSDRHPTPFSRHRFVSGLDRAIVAWLFVLAAAAPHSIAATQIAWMCGMLLWVVRLILRPRFHRTPVDYALAAFMLLTVISAFTSYAPDISTGKLRAASLFTIIYLIAENVHTRRVLRLLALVLIASCMVNVVYTMVERAVGRGVKVEAVSATSPLARAVFRAANGQVATGIQSGDILLEVDGRKLRTPLELVSALDKASPDSTPARIKIYRAEWTGVYEVVRGSLLDGATPVERLGIGGWSRGRDWRATGFYGHYVTYSEALQLIASLAFGLLIALPLKRSTAGALLLACVIGFGLALLLTVTRASQLGFLISTCVIVLTGVRSRRAILLMSACALPLVLAGLFVLQQKRGVSFFDSNDGSISWRETVWREGFQLLVSKPRHLLVGVGMDSVKRYGCDWGLFDHCKLPTGHMHSTPLQFALERGLPALVAWLVLVFVYARMLWRLARSETVGGWIERGIAFGALGGLAGFFASGLVHYNFGDSEVVMIFYFMMGLSLALERQTRSELEARLAR
jgi:uncharacterized membrane protein